MTVALFCGSREWTDPGPVCDEIARLEPGDVVIHGDARGADLIADTEARKAGLEVISDPADWGLGPKAGILRNERMLKTLLSAARKLRQPVRVVAFHGDPKLGVGTRDMVRRSLMAGIRPRVWIGGDLEMRRVGTYGSCNDCGLPYLKHPIVISELDWNDDPYLELGCDGIGLKL